MAFLVLCFLVLLAINNHSSATYCVCKDGLSEGIYQKDIDYACGQGADCTPIQQNGACFNPNTVKDHCNYAVNSYFQRKGQVSGSCDFSGSATTTASLSSQQGSTCVYPSSGSSTGTTPTTPGTGTTTPTTPISTTPPTTPGTGTTLPSPPSTGTTTPGTGTTTPGTGTGTGTMTPPTGTNTPSTGTGFGTPPSSIFGLGPTSINPTTDTSKAHSKRSLVWALALLSGPLLFLTV